MQALANLFAALALGAASGQAGPAVTLNGASIDGVTNQRMENCTVVIDAQGDIHIEAKGHAVRLSPAGTLSHRYFLAEITKFLHPGPNRVVLAATKRAEGRRGSSKDVTFKVVLGEGTGGNDSMVMNQPLVEMKRTQAETENYTQEYTMVAN